MPDTRKHQLAPVFACRRNSEVRKDRTNSLTLFVGVQDTEMSGSGLGDLEQHP